MNIFDSEFWLDSDGTEYKIEYVENEINQYTKKGGKIYIGSDSMFCSGRCSFISVIAFHDKNLNVAKYYYKRLRHVSNIYSDLKMKIFEEVNLSLQVAEYITKFCPKAIPTVKKNNNRTIYSILETFILIHVI